MKGPFSLKRFRFWGGRSSRFFFAPPHFFCNSARFSLLEGSEDKNSLNRTENPMKETIVPTMSIVPNGTSVTYSFSPSLHDRMGPFGNFISYRAPLSADEESLFLRQGD